MARADRQGKIASRCKMGPVRAVSDVVMIFRLMLLGVLWTGLSCAAELPRMPRLHDPSTVVTEKGVSWCFGTGNGVAVLRRDDQGWQHAGELFPRDALPAWHREKVPENEGHLWAPDVIRVGSKWWVYYSVSSFGRNRSAIGLASRSKLGPGTAEEPWVDEGVVIASVREDRFNAIDPAVIADGGRLWMSFGSFWDGIMMVELDRRSGLMKEPGARPLLLATAPEIEAPFIHREGGWYHLFVNWGKCCRGVESTYEIRVGRSREITGPYLDREGTPLTAGGGSLLLGTRGRFIGPGHASIYRSGGRPWLMHHYYDGAEAGQSKLRGVPLKWVDGWPVVEGGAVIGDR